MSNPRYQVGLGAKILSRARLVLGLLLSLLTVFVVAGIHQGIVSGDLNKVFIKPFKEFATDLEKATTPTPTPTPKPSATPSQTPAPVKKFAPAVQQAQPVVSNCIRKNIREGEFASNKCYSANDYDDLEYYLQRFNSAVFSLDGAEASMRITCSGSDFFKDSCERDKKEKSQAESDISKYRGIIQGVIAKGR